MRRTILAALAATVCLSGWGLFINAHVSNTALRKELKAERTRIEKLSGLTSNLDTGAAKLGELMVNIQSRQRELEALGEKYQKPGAETAALKRDSDCGAQTPR